MKILLKIVEVNCNLHVYHWKTLNIMSGQLLAALD